MMENLLNYRAFLFEPIAEAMEEMLILIDEDFRVTFMNQSAKRMLGTTSDDYIGRHFFDELGAWVLHGNRENTKVHEVLKRDVAVRGIMRQTTDGRTLSVNLVPVTIHEGLRGVLITAEDVTHLREMEQELDMAFALTLPNSKVEYRLRSIPEYQDWYNPDTKQITITGIVVDGGYRHVVNCLKIFSQLTAKGVSRLIGIDKDELVQVFVYHDIGKSQPILKVGDVVDPRSVFEDGKQHADRSADMAKYYYNQNDDIVDIIRFHHHSERELPETFPRRLLPMLRLFQIVDGTSAAVTRGGVSVCFDVQDCTVKIREVNHRPEYNGIRTVNLYTGQREWEPLGEHQHPQTRQ